MVNSAMRSRIEKLLPVSEEPKTEFLGKIANFIILVGGYTAPVGLTDFSFVIGHGGLPVARKHNIKSPPPCSSAARLLALDARLEPTPTTVPTATHKKQHYNKNDE